MKTILDGMQWAVFSLVIVLAGCALGPNAGQNDQNGEQKGFWSQPAENKAEFLAVIAENLPAGCKTTNEAGEIFKYQGAYASSNDTRKSEIAYEMKFDIEDACFDGLMKRLVYLQKVRRLSLRNKRPDRIAEFDPHVIVFYFSASQRDLEDLRCVDDGSCK